MRPKVAAAIITGTMARPSRPSVRLTALPAPTITKMPSRMNRNAPSGRMTFLKNGTVSEEEKPAGAEAHHAIQAASPATTTSARKRNLPETPALLPPVTLR